MSKVTHNPKTNTYIVQHTDGLFYATYIGKVGGIGKGCGKTPEEAESAAIGRHKQDQPGYKFPKRSIK